MTRNWSNINQTQKCKSVRHDVYNDASFVAVIPVGLVAEGRRRTTKTCKFHASVTQAKIIFLNCFNLRCVPCAQETMNTNLITFIRAAQLMFQKLPKSPALRLLASIVFLAKPCNCIAISAFVKICRLSSSVVCLEWDGFDFAMLYFGNGAR